jgi:C1A family cysteine protease/PKD repeat protein
MKIALTIIIAFSCYTALAQNTPEKAPFAPDFLQYLEIPKESRTKKSSLDKGRGYIPVFYNFHFDQNIISHESKKSIAFPETYDLRNILFGQVTPIRDQGPLGACWSFSTMGAIESNWLKKGYGISDLSEQNMATCHGFTWGIDDGGNDYIALAYLTRLKGPVTEESDPYSINPNAVCKTSNLLTPAYTPTASFLPKDIKIIKAALMKHGAISASMYTGGAGMNNFYNTSNYTFYYGGTAPPDHGVLIIGWDDNKLVTGGPGSPGNAFGAWIVKNSWGSSFGNEGYFYIAYKDTRVLSSATIFPTRAEIDEIDTLYYNDYLGATSSYGFRQETAFALTKFHAPKEHFIRKIGTFVNAAGTMIDIEIYNSFQGDTLLKGLIASSYNNVVQFPGYQTFDIPAIVNGDYYVKLKYFTPGYNYPVPVEAEIVFQGQAFALPAIKESGHHWISQNSEKWLPLGNDIPEYEADLCIRAYADKSTEINPFFTSDKKFVCVGSPVTFTDESLGNISEYLWEFGFRASPRTANTKGPHLVTYERDGEQTISLTVKNAQQVSKTLIRKAYVESKSSSLDILLPYSNVQLVRGKSLPITAFGADTYIWSPSLGLNTSSGSTVIASPNNSTNYTVTGYSGACSGSNTISINIVDNPVNDDVCQAIELMQNSKQGPFTNVYATVEDGEPAPPEGDCNEPLKWCVEGGLQNSVWFWFTGPENGSASFSAEGFDTQMAIYKASGCEDILNDNWELIAANDDYFGEDKFYAAALNSVSLIPGQKYLLQIDGSAGGEEGVFYIDYSNYPLKSSSLEPENFSFSIFPNPAQAEFNFKFFSGDNSTIDVKILNLQGQVVFSKEFENSLVGVQSTIHLAHAIPGFYIMEVSDGSGVYRKSLIIR